MSKFMILHRKRHLDFMCGIMKMTKQIGKVVMTMLIFWLYYRNYVNKLLKLNIQLGTSSFKIAKGCVCMAYSLMYSCIASPFVAIVNRFVK